MLIKSLFACLPLWVNAQAAVALSPTISLPWNTYTATGMYNPKFTFLPPDVRLQRALQGLAANSCPDLQI